MKRAWFALSFILLSVSLYGQGFAVSADKMNVAYIGIDNPLTVVAEGYRCDQLEVSCPNGTMTKTEDCNYNFRPVKEGTSEIEIKARTASGLKQVGIKKFRVNVLPNATAEIVGKSSGLMPTTIFKVQIGVFAPWHHFGYYASMKVTSFKVVFFREGQLLHTSVTSGSYFDKSTLAQMKNLKPGDRVSVTDINAVGPDSRVHKLNDIDLTLN